MARMRTIRIAMVQMNPTVGDLEWERPPDHGLAARGQEGEGRLGCIPELAITGYPPEDLLLKPRFVADNLRASTK
jgi:NAD+ synthase (glutamine-hydrolysing)